MGSGITQAGQQLFSPLQLQQRHQGFLDDRHKASGTSVSYTKPPLSSGGQPSLGSTNVDLISNQKSAVSQSLQVLSSQHPTSGSATVSSTPGFLRSSRGLTSQGMPRQHSYSTGFGAALNIETLIAAAGRRDTPIEEPASEIQDKILFMINNISASNTDAKSKEFTDVLKEQYYPWFAQYMVMKRASIEPNFHELYLKFLEKVNSRLLNKEIVKATYENCKVLLRSELIKSSSEECSLLKNLGSWLGKFTIGRNQALRAREIDPKELIIEVEMVAWIGRRSLPQGFNEYQMSKLKSSEAFTAAREREITQVVQSVNELAQIMKDLSVLVIDQRTIVNRLDYNIQNVAASVEEGFYLFIYLLKLLDLLL